MSPSVGADVEALVSGDQALVCEVNLGLIAFPGDLESNLGALPPSLVLGEVEVTGYYHFPGYWVVCCRLLTSC